MTQIRELRIDGFGCLRCPEEAVRFEPERITLLLDDNEAGKTTLQTALVASLYGIETDRRLLRTSLRPHSSHWYPLSGPPFGTRLRVHDGQRLLEIRWDFADSGTLCVVDLETNVDVTEDLCPGRNGLELGRRLLDLTIQEFAKTCLVGQEDLARVRRPEGLDSLVQRAADSQAGDATVARALDALQGVLRDYPHVVMLKGGSLDNESKRLQEDAEELQRRLAKLEGERERIADDDASFQRLAAERDQLRAEAARLDYLAQAAEHDELADRIQKAREARERLAALEAERKELAYLESFPADQAEPLAGWQANRLDTLREAEQAEQRIAGLQANALEPARRELHALGRLAEVEQDDVDGAHQLLGRTRDFESREQALADAIRQEEERLASEGASIEELDRLGARFQDIGDEERELLLNQERDAARIASEIEQSKRRTLEVNLDVDRIMDARQREREAAGRAMRNGLVVGGAGLVAGILVALWNPLVGAAVFVVVAGAGVALAVKGHQRAAAAESLQADELAAARNELAQLEERRERLAADQRDRETRLKSLARLCGYEQPEVLVEDYGALDDLRRLCGTLIHLRGQVGDVARQREAVEAEVDERFAAYEAERRRDLPLSEALSDLQEQMGRALRCRQRMADAERRIAEEQARMAELRERADELGDRIRAVLTDAGLADAASIEEGVEQFNARLKDHERLRRLADVRIPQQREVTVDEAVVEAWQADLDRLHRVIATQREEHPELVSVQVAERAAEYRRQRDAVRETLERLAAEADEAGSRVVGVLNRYHEDRPKLLADLADREAQLARARRHREALQLAIETLEQIAREVHGRWAEELNRSTSQLLQRIAPTLSELKFDNRLRFGVWHEGGNTPVRSTEVSPILSVGAWDQLYFAVRLGLAEFVAQRGAPGLLLLDDPFAHFDDTRFVEAMRVLADLAGPRHQVVLFSCQRQRFQWLRSQDPEWFDAHIASRNVPRAGEPT